MKILQDYRLIMLIRVLAAALMFPGVDGRDEKTVQEMYEAQFRQFDSNDDGLIDAQELRALLGDLAEHHLDAYFRKTDTNKDGAVSWTEFVGDALSEDGKA
ncbi:hypothetical protein FOZ61_004682 [Perkinsus olseni]|uniref:EF-hand domain-containing protein n=1 Tax=Perkinsus olseni TaxID=32597 RepID=A0A7J6LK64_PEROL|nr:hypothetical protein FOZ61_004682 [Perkinsus olseni]